MPAGKSITVGVWTGNYGDYVIPVEITECLVFTKRGAVDWRYRANKALKEWAEGQEQQAGKVCNASR